MRPVHQEAAGLTVLQAAVVNGAMLAYDALMAPPCSPSGVLRLAHVCGGRGGAATTRRIWISGPPTHLNANGKRVAHIVGDVWWCVL